MFLIKLLIEDMIMSDNNVDILKLEIWVILKMSDMFIVIIVMNG